jgi:hypothetical protein
MFFLKKTRSVAIAILAIFSILLVANGQAAAAATGGAPGERDGGGWTPEQVLGGQTYSSPTVVCNPNGRTIGTNTVAFTELAANGSSLFGAWAADINHWQTQWAINLTVIAGVVYAIMTGMSSNVYYKPSFNGNPR